MNWEELTPAERLVAEQAVLNLRSLNRTCRMAADGQVLRLAEAGKAVLVISSEHQELFGLCDRVLVMGEGRLRGELRPPDYSEENLLSLAISRQEPPNQGERRS